MEQRTANIYYTNFNPPLSVIPEKQFSTIVIGESGMGKSKLVNNLCDSKHRVGIDRKGITQQIQSQTCKYINQFHISDSPGIQSKKKYILENIRDEIKWKTIFILTKLTTRFGNQTLPKLRNVGKMLRKQNVEVVFLVSHLDILDRDPNKKNVLDSFHQTVNEQGFKQKIIIFSNLNSEFDHLSDLMYYICSINERNRQSIIKEMKISEKNQRVDVIKQQIQPQGCWCGWKQFKKLIGW